MPKGLGLFLLASLLMVASVVCSNTALAHQQKAAETTVLLNKRSNHVEIMHRFYLHDTEHAVQSLFNKTADILDSKETQQQFADYVAEQFFARTLDGKALPLSNVGYEVEGKFFWVYQDTPLPANLEGMQLYNGSLRDIWPMQINMVNVEGKGNVKTLYFQDDKDWLVVKF